MTQKRFAKIPTAESVAQEAAMTVETAEDGKHNQKSIIDEAVILVREKRAIAESHRFVVDTAKKKEAKAKIELVNTTELLTEARDEANNDPGGFADYSIDTLEHLKDAAQSRVVGAKNDRKASELRAKALDKDTGRI